jgi:PadR family transcriptional regulator PadR
MRAEELKGNLDGMLLAVLSKSSLHGYAIIETLRERSAGKVDLPSGTVYPALHRLESAGLLRSKWEQGNGRRRRVYEITPAGHTSLSNTRANWREMMDTINAVVMTDEVAF